MHTQRYFRWHQDENGGIRGEFFSDEIAWARVAPGLEAEAKARWKAAGAAAGDSLEAHRMDALIDILSGTGGKAGGGAGRRGTARVETLVIIDAAGPAPGHDRR